MSAFITKLKRYKALLNDIQLVAKLEQRLTPSSHLKAYTFHISLYDLAFVGTIFIGLAVSVLLWRVIKTNRTANRLLSLALTVVVLQVVWVLGIDVELDAYSPYWSRLPLHFSLALGPLIYLYVRKITRPEYQLRWRHLLHFIPLLLEQVVWLLGVSMSIKIGTAIYNTQVFQQLNPILQVLTLASVMIYLYRSLRMIKGFHQRLRYATNDAGRNDLRRLQYQLMGFGLIWLLWIPYAIVDSNYQYQLGIETFHPLYLLLGVMTIWITSSAFSAPEIKMSALAPPLPKSAIPAELMEKGLWLKRAMDTHSYYRDAELTLSILADKLDIHTHELSRIINGAFGKNFNDLVNEYRIREVTRKMQDPAYDHLTLLGIAFDCGFNSKTTFNRTFKEVTGKSPAEYKIDLKKERPTYKLERRHPVAGIISSRETTPMWSSGKLNRNYMFKNYFKIAWRHMLHSKVYSALNIAGLAAGMAVALLIGLWIYSQYAYDRFLPGYDQLYQVKLNFYHSGEVHTQSGCALPMIEKLKKSYPEVKYASETDWGGQHSLVTGDKKLDPFGMMVGADFLKMFPYPMVKGNLNTAFNDPNSIILTESVAKALFGDKDPINRTIRIDNKNNVTVTGIMKDVPLNSTLQFTYLLPYSYKEQTYPETRKDRTNWENTSSPEYLQLQQGANAEAFQNKIRNLIPKKDPNTKIEVLLQPAKNWRLLSVFNNGKATDGFIKYVRMFGIIGILVLVIACINFVNLSTARAEKRAREVGVRKAIGSLRKDLILQFLSESLMTTMIAFAVSVLVVQLVLPFFNNISYSNIKVPYTNGTFWCIMLGYVLVTGLLAGSRPAFYLSSFKPIKVLKGTIQLGKNAALPRKIMVVAQFTCSIALIISTLVIYQQLQYAKDRPKGYIADNLVMVNSSDDLNKNFEPLKHDLLQSGQVVNITRSASSMMYFPASFNIKDFPGKKSGESMEIACTAVSADYFKTIGMKVLEGHEFASEAGPDTLNLVINEAAAQKMRLKNPLDQLITFDYSSHPMRVIGVVESAIVGSPFYSAGPAIYVYNPGWTGSIMYRMNPTAKPQQATKKIGDIFNKYNPSFPFDYRFADEAFAATLQLEELVGTLAGIFAGLAIFISCLGLFGLAAYVAEQRKKEIGIRKVLGASVPQVWTLLSRDFILLVGISCVVASPLAFYFLHGWLQNFDYRVAIGPGAFLTAAALTIVITVITISYQAISSAMANPVKSLRTE